MRILHVLTHGAVDRGGAVQAMLLARGHLQRGHEVLVVCNALPKRSVHASFARWIANGVDVRPFKMNRPTELLRFRRLVRQWEPDVVHGHRNTALQFVYAATRIGPPVPFVFQRGTTRPPQGALVKQLLRSRRVHRIVGVAEAVRTSLVEHGVPRQKIEVVYGSYDEARFDPARTPGDRIRAKLGVPDGGHLVVQVGKLNKRKAPEDFVKMAALVRDRYPDTVFALVGGGGKRSATVHRLRDRLNLEKHLQLLGFRNDVPEIYAAADVVVNTSRDDEGLTGALREGAAMGKPLVATAISGNPELVRPGETGYLAPPRDPSELAAGVMQLLDDPERARRMGAAARALVRREMTEERRLQRMEEIYAAVVREVMAERAAAR